MIGKSVETTIFFLKKKRVYSKARSLLLFFAPNVFLSEVKSVHQNYLASYDSAPTCFRVFEDASSKASQRIYRAVR